MSIDDILVFSLCTGIIGIILAFFLLISSFITSLLPYNKSLNNVILKISKIAKYTLYAGIFLFMISLAGLLLYFAVDGIQKGEYNLIFSRYGGYKTHISWDKQPIRFSIQTIGFIGFSMYLIFKAIKDFSPKKYNKHENSNTQ